MHEIRRSGGINKPVFFPERLWVMKALRGTEVMSGTLQTVHVLLVRRQKKGPDWKPGDLRFFCHISMRLASGNPKDIIYALQSLIDIRFRIDYTDRYPVESLYTDFAKAFIERNQLSEVLACAGTGKQGLRSLVIPSWVPDWQHLSRQGFHHTEHLPNHLFIWEAFFHTDKGMNLPLPTVADEFLRVQGCILELATGYSFFSSNTGVFLEDLLDFCVQYLERERTRQLLRVGRLFDSTGEALRHMISTLLRDMQPDIVYRVPKATDRLHGEMRVRNNGIDLVLLFLSCIIDHPRQDDARQRQAKVCQNLRRLGYDSPEQLFDDFPNIQQAPGVHYDFPYTPYLRPTGEIPRNITIESFADFILLFRLHREKSCVLGTIEHTLKSRVMETSRGRLALVPSRTIEGDLICAIKGCRFPVVLRKVEDAYFFLGGAFRYGMMDGEAAQEIQNRRCKVQQFTIK
jgi:hypothetical protein